MEMKIKVIKSEEHIRVDDIHGRSMVFRRDPDSIVLSDRDKVAMMIGYMYLDEYGQEVEYVEDKQ